MNEGFRKFLSTLAYFLSRKLIRLAHLAVRKKISAIDADKIMTSVGLIRPSSKTPKVSRYEIWSESHRLVRTGNFHKGIALRKEALEAHYARLELPDDHLPWGLASSWSSNMGHIGWLLSYVGYLEQTQKKYAPRMHLFNWGPFHNSFKPFSNGKYLNSIGPSEAALLTELPMNWHLFEPLETVRLGKEFLDSYELIESIYKLRSVSKETPLVKLPEWEIENARALLWQQFNFPRDAWFVCLHVRRDDDRRGAPLSSFFPAIRKIIASGGWVIRVGLEGDPLLPEQKQVVDLAAFPELQAKLLSFALSSCEFYVGTQSGPAQVPPAFGVPTLQTNSTSIGRTTFTWSKNSIHLPKVVLESGGRSLTFRETLDSVEGFGELSSRQLANRGLQLRCNTAEEILLSVEEMLERRSERGTPPPKSREQLSIESRRQSFSFATNGEFSKSFIALNRGWATE